MREGGGIGSGERTEGKDDGKEKREEKEVR